jgi:hypothetical protein
MQNEKAVVFKGDTFRNLMRQYDEHRMATDPQYKAAADEAQERKAKRAAERQRNNPK